MNPSIFKKAAIATAVGTALIAGAANAAPASVISIDVQGPTRSGEQFTPQLDAKMLVVSSTNGAVTAADMKLSVIYLDDTNSPIGGATTVTDSDGNDDAVQTYAVTSEASAGAINTVLIVTDNDDDPATYRYIERNGTLSAAPAFASIADARDAAIAADDPDDQTTGIHSLHPVDQDYAGIKLVTAKRDLSKDATEIYLTFNADPYLKSALGVRVAAGATLATAPVDAANDLIGLTDEAGDALGAVVSATDGSLITAVPTGGPGVFATLPQTARTSASASPDLDDATDDDNGVKSSGLITIETLTPPAFGSGKVSVVVNGNADDLYGDGNNHVVVMLRMDQGVHAPSWDVQADVDFDNANIVGTPAGVFTDDDGQNVGLFLNVDALVGSFFIDPATGELLHDNGGERAKAVAVSVTLVGTDSGNAGAIGLQFNNGNTQLADDLKAGEAIVAGINQAVRTITSDSDVDGWIDGITVDFRQPITALAGGANIKLTSYQDTTGQADVTDPDKIIIDRPVVLGTTLGALSADKTTATLKLASIDTPNADGTAGTATNDYNASLAVDEDDNDLVVGDNFDTATDSTFGPAGLPFMVEIGVDEDASDGNDTHETGLKYSFVFDSKTGEQKGVAVGELTDPIDGAKPVVTRVEYIETVAQDEEVNGQPRDASGTLTIVTSEAIDGAANVGEFLFDGKPVSLWNLDANIANKAVTDIMGDEIKITNAPGTIFGTTLSLGVEPDVVDLSVLENPLVVNNNGADNEVQEPAVEEPAMLSAKPIHGTDALKWNQVVVTYDQDVEAANTIADLDKVFVVRARVGAKRIDGQGFEDRESGDNSDDAYYDFRIPGKNVAISGAEVTLTLPIDDFPADTVEIWVDYEGAGADALEDDATRVDYIRSVAKKTPANVDGMAGDEQLFTGLMDINNNGWCGDDADSEIGELADLTLVDRCVNDNDNGGIYEDEDTVEADVPDLFLASHARDNHRKLFTQTVQGTIEQTNPTTEIFGSVIDDAGVRVDLMRATVINVDGQVAKDAVVGDGSIEVRRGPNSDNKATPNGDEFGADTDGAGDLDHNDSDETDQWQSIALLNKAVTTTLIKDFYKLQGDIAAEWKKFDAAVAEGKPQSDLNKIEDKAVSLENKLETKYGNGEMMAFIEVTTGNGKDGVDSSRVNPNANVGRTATLLSKLPNTIKNGTTAYTVTVSLWDGEIEPYGHEDGVQSLQHGEIIIKAPVAAKDRTTKPKYEILDTAYTHVENGQYKAVVGMVEDSVDSKTKALEPRYDDAFILVSVKDTNTGEWVLTNQADPSFDSHISFAADLMGNGTATKHNINLDNNWAVPMPERDASIWQILGIPGEMARDDEDPLNMGRFFITINPADGNPITVWENDDAWDNHEMAFTLGLSDKSNEMQLVFELGGNHTSAELKQYGEINPVAGAAIAYNGNNASAQDWAGTGDHDHGDSRDGDHLLMGGANPTTLFVPLTGSAVAWDLGEGWHLISLLDKQSIAEFVKANSDVDAVLVFVGTAGGGNEVRNYTYFAGDDINAAELSEMLPKGTGAFVHVKK